jgi:hypothetical protein
MKVSFICVACEASFPLGIYWKTTTFFKAVLWVDERIFSANLHLLF